MANNIVDNFLNKNSFNEIKTIIESNYFPWYWNDQVTSKKSNLSPYYFTHLLYENNMIQSPYYEKLILPILEKLKVKAIIRIKINSYTNVNKFIENENHTDYQFEHKGAIFYLNTNNGYTILENGTKIESVENRLLQFDPHKTHRSTHCTDAKRRLNININYF